MKRNYYTMSVKIRKATENSLYSFENYTKYVFEQWFAELSKEMKEQEKTFREKIVKTCVSQFTKEFSVEDDDVEELYSKLRDVCQKHKFGKLKVTCPDFIINEQHTKEDIENIEKGKELHDYKKFLFKISKKKEPTERKQRRPVSAYHLYQSEERAKLKKKGLSTDEIRKALKKGWEQVKADDDAFKEYDNRANNMKQLPNKKPSNSNGCGRTAYHLFQKNEKKKFQENNPDANVDEIRDHIKDAWQKVKNNDSQYAEYLKLAEEKQVEKNEEKKEKVDVKKEKKIKKEKKEKKAKEKAKNKKKKVVEEEEEDEPVAAVDSDAESENDAVDAVVAKDDEIVVDESDDDFAISEPEHSDDDSDMN